MLDVRRAAFAGFLAWMGDEYSWTLARLVKNSAFKSWRERMRSHVITQGGVNRLLLGLELSSGFSFLNDLNLK